MTGTADPNSVYSAITLAAFADMGWYAVSQTRAQRLPWGNGLGCSFVQDACSGWPSRYFCTVASQGGCTPDLRYRALCNLFDAPYTLPSQFQYFPGLSGRGGQNAYVDYCPVYWRLSNGDCLSTSTVPLWFYGETVGSASRCFSGTYQRTTITQAPGQHAGCLDATCTLSNLLQVRLVQSGGTRLTVVCPRLGGDVNLATLPGSEFTGVLNCPPADVMCTGNPCDNNNCNNRGTCNSADGTCACQSGFYGDTIYDCANRFCPYGTNETGSSLQVRSIGDEKRAADAAAPLPRYRRHPRSAPAMPHATRCWADARMRPGSPAASRAGRTARVALAHDGYVARHSCALLHIPACVHAACSARTHRTLRSQGCPVRTSTACNTTAPCECSGRGACVTGICNCTTGFIGNDCSVTDCPFASGQRCGGATAGTCDGARGFCECADAFDDSARPIHFVGSGCETRINSTRSYPQLLFDGEYSAAMNATGAVRPVQHRRA